MALPQPWCDAGPSAIDQSVCIVVVRHCVSVDVVSLNMHCFHPSDTRPIEAVLLQRHLLIPVNLYIWFNR